MRYQFIEEHSNEFLVEKMCALLRVSKSGYYKWRIRMPSKRSLFNTVLIENIQRIYTANKGRYGSPRIAKELQMQGFKASENLVAKLMKKEKLRSITQRRFKQTTDSKHKYPVVENKLMQQFTVAQKNTVWVSDLTYIHTNQGWLYLTTVIDLYDRKVIGWAMSHRMYTKETSIAALKMAVSNRPIQTGNELTFHSDRGVQYACEEFVSEISKHKTMVRSMSRKGNYWDNAVAESFFKPLKVELVYQNSYHTRNEAALSIFEYIKTFYNTKRRHKQLNNLTILEHQSLFNHHQKNAA